MSLTQYKQLMSNLLKERHSLAKLREKLEERKGKLYQCCKKFGHLAHNCRNRKEGEEGTIVLQNKFEVLKSRVMQCRVEERTIRRQEVIVVECFKCGEQGHKCKECPLWRKMKKERRLRRIEEEKAVHVVMPQKTQQEKKLSRVEEGSERVQKGIAH